MNASGIEMLKPLLPGLERVLEDQQVSEIMINGPGNVWIEKNGKLDPLAAPDLDSKALGRAAIHIARPLGLDPALSPLVDARLDDGSRVAICMPPASPMVAITVRRFGGRSFSTDDLVRQGVLAEEILNAAAKTLR
ncbi:MAG: ATPase, T2SS/T4P/T4SS family, partial [Acidobacteriota bacterium]|nr:ATPase, T2SS/T4P/T4SS family [Acidobacteriota bacterium]